MGKGWYKMDPLHDTVAWYKTHLAVGQTTPSGNKNTEITSFKKLSFFFQGPTGSFAIQQGIYIFVLFVPYDRLVIKAHSLLTKHGKQTVFERKHNLLSGGPPSLLSGRRMEKGAFFLSSFPVRLLLSFLRKKNTWSQVKRKKGLHIYGADLHVLVFYKRCSSWIWVV